MGQHRLPRTALIVDPSRGNTSYTATYLSSPNKDLQPETGHSYSIGAVYSSERLAGFESSLTYWAVDYDNYIAYVNQQDAVNYPQFYPGGIVTRSAPTARGSVERVAWRRYGRSTPSPSTLGQ